MRSVNIFEVEGLLFNGGHATDSKGENYNFPPAVVEKIYNNIHSGIHCEINHGGSRVGYVHKWWLTESRQDIGYNAIVYDPQGMVAIRDEGYSAGSPDLDLVIDDEGTVIDGTLKALAFVKDPAMDNTGLRIIRAAFSRKEGDPNMVDKKEGEDTIEETEEEQSEDEQVEEQTEEQEDSEDSTEEPGEPTIKEMMALLQSERKERKALETKLNSVVSGNKKLANAQLESLKADIKGHGINPDDLIKGLNDKQAMQVLQTLKATMAGKRSLSSTPKTTGTPGNGKQARVDETFQGALRFLGMDMDTYLELTGKKKGE